MSITKQNACSRVVRQFHKTTTLHGFKYLCSKYFSDRVGWLICCCASACCAGVLCAVLWARFQQVPALLTTRELHARHGDVRMPLVAVCPPAKTFAEIFAQRLFINETTAEILPSIIDRVLRKKFASTAQLQLLEDTLKYNNLTLADTLMKVMPPCHTIVRNCRWQSMKMSCREIFRKELTQWGVCCTTRPSDSKIKPPLYTRMELTRRLTLAMQCSDKPMPYGCEFFTKYDGEEWVEPTALSPGRDYMARLAFTSVLDSDPDKLVDETCVSSRDYSRSQCLLACKEKYCGCSHPLRTKPDHGSLSLPLCSMTKLNCLRSIKLVNQTCNCLPSCRKVTTTIALESSEMNAFQYTFDEIYAGLNETTSIVLNIIIRLRGSKEFVVMPTETWITLLSSLGGVFNMFLGVGLFSALEILFLIFVKLPIAIRKSSEMDNTVEAIN